MVKKLYNFRNSLFLKLMIIIILACIPALLLGVVVNYVSYSEDRNRTIKTIKETSENNFAFLDNEIVNAYEYQSELVNNPYLEKLMFMDSFTIDIYSDIEALKTSMTMIKNANAVIEDLKVFLPGIKKTLSAKSGFYDFDAIEYYKVIGVDGKNNTNRMLYINGKLYLSILLPVQTAGEFRYALILLELSMPQINNSISGKIKNDFISSFIVIYNNVISENDSNFIKNSLLPDIKGNSIMYSLNLSKDKLILYRINSNQLGYSYYTCINERYMKTNINKFMIAFLGTLFLMVIIIIIAFRLLKNLISRPIERLFSSFAQIERGNFDCDLNPNNNTYEFNRLFSYFNSILNSMKKLIASVYEDGVRLMNAEYKQLSSQIEPHFLYNSLHIINCMSKNEDYEGITNMTLHLSAYYKFLTGIKRSEVTIKEEFEHVKHYIDIQQIRFGERITVQLSLLPNDLAELFIPYLTLQPIVENVYTHGLQNKQEDCIFTISFDSTDHTAVIIIEDNGEELTHETLEELRLQLISQDREPNKSLALTNVNKRLQIKFGIDYGLSLDRSPLGGLKVKIVIPKNKEE